MSQQNNENTFKLAQEEDGKLGENWRNFQSIVSQKGALIFCKLHFVTFNLHAFEIVGKRYLPKAHEETESHDERDQRQGVSNAVDEH